LKDHLLIDIRRYTLLILPLLVVFGILGIGNDGFYVAFFLSSIYFLVKYNLITKIPIKIIPLLTLVIVLIAYSSIFASIINHQLIYSGLYLGLILITFFAYYFNYKAMILILSSSYGLSAIIISSYLFGFSVVDVFISMGFDPNFCSYFLISSIFLLFYVETGNKRFKTFTIFLFILCGLLLQSRSFILLLVCMLGVIFWNKNIIVKFIILIGIVIGIFITVGFFNQNPLILQALGTTLEGAPDIDGMIKDRRRIGLLSTGLIAIFENFPYGTGLGPRNYALAVIDMGIQPPSYIRLGYPHNYFISILAQAGIAGLFFLLYLIFLAISSVRSFPVIIILLMGIFFNEYIGLPALWCFIGMYLSNAKMILR